jgi:hypothetical protein
MAIVLSLNYYQLGRLTLARISLAREYLAKALNYWVWSLLSLFEEFANS